MKIPINIWSHRWEVRTSNLGIGSMKMALKIMRRSEVFKGKRKGKKANYEL